MNLPPDLIRVSPPEPDLLFDRDPVRISVIAADPEGDPLTFIWQPPPFVTGVESETLEEGIYVWTVDIPYTEDADGQVFALTVLDQDPIERGTVTLVWRGVIP